MIAELKTPFYEVEKELGAHVTQFAGFNLPLYFSSVVEEAKAVRSRAGFFNISHMGRIKVRGKDALEILNKLFTRDLRKIGEGRGLYGAILNEKGGVKDDLIVYKSNKEFFIVVNAGTREKDIKWFNSWARCKDFVIDDITFETAFCAIQGKELNFIPELLRNFGVMFKSMSKFSFFVDGDFFISRTGYTGEDGYEIIMPKSVAVDFMREALKWAEPCGLGARDILRLEAGYLLYGQDIDETTLPLGSPLERFLDEKDFIGKDFLEEARKKGNFTRLIKIMAEGVPRSGHKVLLNDEEIGFVTSGVFSPHLKTGIGFARVKRAVKEGEELVLEGSGRRISAKVKKWLV